MTAGIEKRLTPQETAAPKRAWVMYGRCLFVACLLVHFSFSLPGWRNSLLDRHGFRQTQTAITAYYFAKEGFKLAYETPILGAPWSIPIEFPIYQAIVAFIHKASGLPLEQVGRATTLFFFYGCLAPVYLLVRGLSRNKLSGYIALCFLLLSPLYLFWSRTLMIESTSLCFSMIFLMCLFYAMQTRRLAWILSGSLAGLLAALAKVTTFSLSLAVGAMLVLVCWIDRKEERFTRKTLQFSALLLFLCAVLPIIIAIAWNSFADAVKNKNPMADFLLSKNLTGWNFGTFHQKLGFSTWERLSARSFPFILGTPSSKPFLIAVPILVTLLLSVGFWFVLSQRRHIAIFGIGFLLGPMVYTNLFYVHDYYWYANAVFLFIASALILGDLAARPKSGAWVRWVAIPLLLCFLLERYYVRLYPIQRKDGGEELIAAAQTVKALTDQSAVLLIYGYGYDSSFPYYSERRAIMDVSQRPLDNPIMARSLAQTGETNIQALVIGPPLSANQAFAAERVSRLGLSPRPISLAGDTTVYLRKSP